MPSINELNAVVLRLPSGAYPLCGPTERHYLPLILDEGQPWRPFIEGIQWFYATSVVAELCMQRAPLAVDRALTFRGRATTPEAYLRHWRRALREAIDITMAPRLLKLHPIARFRFSAATVCQTSTCWDRPAFKTLGEVIDVHRAALVPLPSRPSDSAVIRTGTDAGSGRVDASALLQLTIDLTDPNGARDAWWVSEFLHPPKPHADPVHASIEFATGPTPGGLDDSTLRA
jgi:hypothetical protein